MIDDNNKDPTFIYTVPETLRKVPTKKEQAAQLVGLPWFLHSGIKETDESTFLDTVENAFYFHQNLDNYANAQREYREQLRPAPLGPAVEHRELSYAGDSRAKFAANMKATEKRLNRAGRSLSNPQSDAGLWVPLAEEY